MNSTDTVARRQSSLPEPSSPRANARWSRPLYMLAAALVGLVILPCAVWAEQVPAQDSWASYLDYAYIFSSASPDELRARLDDYAARTGLPLGDYLDEQLSSGGSSRSSLTDTEQRRQAIAYLLEYLRTGDPAAVQFAASSIRKLHDRLDRHENRYWFHYILAHEALQRGDGQKFVTELLRLWLDVVTELEGPYDTYATLSLNGSGRSGFVSALPHIYENIARIILVRSQTTGLYANLDSLGAMVRMLADDRVGSQPEAIPLESSSKEYLDHIVARLDGPESDGGSLTFTLALVEAEKAHNAGRALLAEAGFSEATLAGVRGSVAAYRRAFRNSDTLQGHCAVYTRALRQLGEIYAAQQRLGVVVDIDIPFGIERAVGIYRRLFEDRNDSWQKHGYLDTGHESYMSAMRGLWSEIQEASFNAADFYLSQRTRQDDLIDDSIVSAVNHYSRCLHLFEEVSAGGYSEALPESAYFGSFVASKGIGDAVLLYSKGDASFGQLDEAIENYMAGIRYFPFDRDLWATLAIALERRGSEGEFIALVKPLAARVAASRNLALWISQRGKWAAELATYRGVFSNDLMMVNFGYANSARMAELESSLGNLLEQRGEVNERVSELKALRDMLSGLRREQLSSEIAQGEAGAAESGRLPSVSSPPLAEDGLTIAELGIEIEKLEASQARVDRRIDTSMEALPVFKEILAHEDLVAALSSQRDHPVHSLVRRMAYELVVEPTPGAEKR